MPEIKWRHLSWITSSSFLTFKIHLYQIIWLSAILAFRFGLSDLHSSGLLHVTGSLANARLRPTKNLAPFHNFCKIVPLRSVFAPVEFSSKTLTSPINCCKQIQNWAVLALFYARLTPSSSQSGEADFWTGNAPGSEQTVPACAKHIRHGSVS